MTSVHPQDDNGASEMTKQASVNPYNDQATDAEMGAEIVGDDLKSGNQYEGHRDINYQSDNTKYNTDNSHIGGPVRREKTVTKNMPDKDYKEVCRQIFEETDTGNYGELDVDQFKAFTIACATSAGVA